ncbi:CamS family sex pheromone protein [Holzapfeliella sp. He02]|uniref:CamS family sex pheromone protein n=1 Tax=Holzapfeliella saturejae TaxID=3082953 RepID=A0ABU8SH82_9LACO
MKKIVYLIQLIILMIVLTGCGNLQNSNLANNNSAQVQNTFQITGTTNDNTYNVLLQDGRYKSSPSRGATATMLNSVDVTGMESGLVQISKQTFSTEKYIFQEGQQISQSDAYNWLGRYDEKDNPEGLNPTANSETDSDKRTPIYLEQLLEQNYMTGSGNNYSVQGISLTLAMNSVDYYQKEKNGATYSTKISREDQEKQGKEMAQKVVERLRQKEGLKNIPIVIALYSRPSVDSLTGGTYFATTTINGDSSAINNWQTIDNQTQVFPIVSSSEKAINSSDLEAFQNFKSIVQGYFPNLSGVIAKSSYENGKLNAMTITVNTQFYGYQQINSFTKLISNSAEKYLPKNVPIEIKVQAVGEVQSVVIRDSNNYNFYSHVFSNEN